MNEKVHSLTAFRVNEQLLLVLSLSIIKMCAIFSLFK